MTIKTPNVVNKCTDHGLIDHGLIDQGLTDQGPPDSRTDKKDMADDVSDDNTNDNNRPAGPIPNITTRAETQTEFGGQKGPDPTRYGDWEKNGRCIDF